MALCKNLTKFLDSYSGSEGRKNECNITGKNGPYVWFDIFQPKFFSNRYWIFCMYFQNLFIIMSVASYTLPRQEFTYRKNKGYG